MKKILEMTAFLLVSNCSIASYTVQIPLEITKSGPLPDGSIQFIDPSAPNNPTAPTEPEKFNCSYNLDDYDNISAYADGFHDGSYIKQTVYKGREVNNGTKGVVQFTNIGIDYAEICFDSNGPIYKVNSADDTGWTEDDCRYNVEPANGLLYYWKEYAISYEETIPRAFQNASLGSFGAISYQTSGLSFPAGTVNTSNGPILPDNNYKIGRGSVIYSRGNNYLSIYTDDGGKEYFYEVCKKTIK